MEKIVIVTSKPEPDYGLLGLLNVLFPEIEIRIISGEIETAYIPRRRRN